MSTDGKIIWTPKSAEESLGLEIKLKGKISAKEWSDFENAFRALAEDQFGLKVKFKTIRRKP